MANPVPATTKSAKSSTKPAGHDRVPFWDNARFASITLVVVGHAIQRLTIDSDNALTVYLFIYAFHMPAFAMISGYFSKSGAPTRRQLLKVVTDILLPYVVMESIWTTVQFLVEGKEGFNLSEPSWTLWFLLALGIFRVILPYLALLRWPLAWAVLASVSVGYFSNVDSTFSMSRAIGILPFFVLGWKLHEWGVVDKWRLVERQALPIRLVAVAVLAAWLAVTWAFVGQWRDFNLKLWFFYDAAYSTISEGEWWAGLLRLGLIVLAVVLCGAFFVLVPRSANWMTGFGQSTMYIYLLHSFVLYPLRETGVLTGQHSSAMWLVGMVFAAIAVSIALSSPLVRRLFQPLVEPRAPWLFVERDAAHKTHTDPTGSRRDRADDWPTTLWHPHRRGAAARKREAAPPR